MNFDGIARYYKLMECLCAGKLLHRCRTTHLTVIDPPKNILLVGEGHAPFLNTCTQQFPNAQVTVVDSSEKMIAIAKKANTSPQAQFIHTDVLEWKPDPHQYDLIVTHFVLDCFTEAQLESVISQLSKAAAQQAQWLVSDFNIPEKGISKWRARGIIWLLYRFFKASTQMTASRLLCPRDLIRKAGFQSKSRKTLDCGLLCSELWVRE